MGLHEDDIYDELPKDYKTFFQSEIMGSGNRAKREYSTIGQRRRRKNGGFGFGYHRHYENGKTLFVERWIPSNPPKVASWTQLQNLAKERNWEIFFSPRNGATSIIVNLEKLRTQEIIDTITSFFDTISMIELDLSFLEAAEKNFY